MTSAFGHHSNSSNSPSQPLDYELDLGQTTSKLIVHPAVAKAKALATMNLSAAGGFATPIPSPSPLCEYNGLDAEDLAAAASLGLSH